MKKAIILCVLLCLWSQSNAYAQNQVNGQARERAKSDTDRRKNKSKRPVKATADGYNSRVKTSDKQQKAVLDFIKQ